MELSAVPCSETSLLVKVVDNSLVTVGGYLPKLMEAGSDFDRSTNANARFSSPNPMWVHKRGNERRVERQY